VRGVATLRVAATPSRSTTNVHTTDPRDFGAHSRLPPSRRSASVVAAELALA
jgi:hypothetical protein